MSVAVMPDNATVPGHVRLVPLAGTPVMTWIVRGEPPVIDSVPETTPHLKLPSFQTRSATTCDDVASVVMSPTVAAPSGRQMPAMNGSVFVPAILVVDEIVVNVPSGGGALLLRKGAALVETTARSSEAMMAIRNFTGNHVDAGGYATTR